MKDKKNLLLALKITGKSLAVIFFAAVVVATGYTMKYCYDFFVYGLFGDGTNSELSGAVMGTVESPTVPSPEGSGIAPVSSATITAAGDLMMHIPVINSGYAGSGNYVYDEIFSQVRSYVSAADYAVLNLETTLGGTENGKEYSGYPNFNAPDGIVDSVKNAGFDMLLTANNHSNDSGADGLRRTGSVIRSRGINVLGTTEGPADPKYQILDINGIKIGMICYTHGTIDSSTGRPTINNNPLDDSVSSLINIFDYNKLDTFYTQMSAHIAGMKEDGAEAIVLFIHWGDEYSQSANDTQTAMAQRLCDLGVDVIAGSHPHAVEPITMLTSSLDPEHQALCFYSMGNFLSNQRHDNIGVESGVTEDGVLFTFSFTKYSDGQVHLDSADVLPTWVHLWYKDDKKAYTILPLSLEIPEWQSEFGIDSSAEAEARSSYDRTMSVIQDGLTAAQENLSQKKLQREAAFAAG